MTVPPRAGTRCSWRRAACVAPQACERAGRDPRTLSTLVVLGYGGELPLASPAAFRECRDRYAVLGADRIAVLGPRGEDADRRLEVLAKALA